MTYRTSDEAIFSAMKLKVMPTSGSSDIVNLMNLDGGGQDYTIFDYDSILHPCNSGKGELDLFAPKVPEKAENTYHLASRRSINF